MPMLRRFLLTCLTALVPALACAPATPTGPIHQVVGVPPGGGMCFEVVCDVSDTKAVREAGQGNPRAGRAMQREQDEFLARRNAEFGKPDFDMQKMMRERLDHLLGLVAGR